jgi:hypothetical protein
MSNFQLCVSISARAARTDAGPFVAAATPSRLQ